jgi:hypothetical protein
MHGLMTSRRCVYDGQAPMSKSDPLFLIHPNIPIIGTAMVQRVRHFPQDFTPWHTL